MNVYEINLDINKSYAYLDQIVVHRVNDVSGTTIHANIFDHETPVALTADMVTTFKCLTPDGKKIIDDTASIANNQAVYILSDKISKTPGTINNAHFQIGGYTTQNFDIKVLEA